MVEIVNNIVATFQNASTVILDDLSRYNLEMLIVGLVAFGMFYFPSKWFKAYFIRLALFLVGVAIVWNIVKQETILFSVEFYFGMGILFPHIEIVEITYLILRERTLYLIDKTIELFLLIISPFIWLYNLFLRAFQFIQLKQEARANRRAEKEYYKEELKREQERAFKEEQERYSNQDKQRQDKESKKEYRYKKKEKKQQQNDEYEYKEDNHQQEEQKPNSRWDSPNPYEVLGIDENATGKEIKKAYRNLAKIYHPDLTLTKEKEYTIILQKINEAYDILK